MAGAPQTVGQSYFIEKLFRDVILQLEKFHLDVLLDTKLLSKVPELGRWDDLLIFYNLTSLNVNGHFEFFI